MLEELKGSDDLLAAFAARRIVMLLEDEHRFKGVGIEFGVDEFGVDEDSFLTFRRVVLVDVDPLSRTGPDDESRDSSFDVPFNRRRSRGLFDRVE